MSRMEYHERMYKHETEILVFVKILICDHSILNKFIKFSKIKIRTLIQYRKTDHIENKLTYSFSDWKFELLLQMKYDKRF